MKISYSAAVNSKIDIAIYPYFENKINKKHVDAKLFKGKSGELLLVPSKRILLLGLGKKDKLESADVRGIFAKAAKALMSDKYNKIGLYWDKPLNDFSTEVLEGLMLANHHVAKYKTGKEFKKENQKLLNELVVLGRLPKGFKAMANDINKVVESVHYVRDIVTGPPNTVSVDYVANEAKKAARTGGFSVKVYDKAWLKKNKMGAILGVNAGSGSNGAKLLIMDYKPNGAAAKKAPIMLVGKGLIFDSGGYNIKPTKYIEDMQQDMAGGATVLGVFKTLKQLKVKRRVVGIVPLTENLIDSNAMKPSDILTAYNGQTIEVRNTDAEGRLILADALAYGTKTFKPEYTIDIATLTGACVVALGDRYAAVMGNDKKLTGKLIDAGNTTDELLWELPLHKDFKKSMKGIIGDLRNADNGTSYLAGSSKAGAFLEYFVGKSKWAHIDIAGTAYVQKPKAHESQYGTGYGVRLLAEFLRAV